MDNTTDVAAHLVKMHVLVLLCFWVQSIVERMFYVKIVFRVQRIKSLSPEFSDNNKKTWIMYFTQMVIGLVFVESVRNMGKENVKINKIRMRTSFVLMSLSNFQYSTLED